MPIYANHEAVNKLYNVRVIYQLSIDFLIKCLYKMCKLISTMYFLDLLNSFFSVYIDDLYPRSQKSIIVLYRILWYMTSSEQISYIKFPF